MNDALEQREPAPGPKQHLSDWTLEQLAEGMLGEYEHQAATAHVESCARCTAELEGYRSLFSALSGLPRFAPSAEFGDAVMARVRVGPQESAAVVWARRWLPATRRGWLIFTGALLAPALPLLGLVAWLFSQPGVSVVSVWGWTVTNATRFGHLAGDEAGRWAHGLGLPATMQTVYNFLLGVPTGVLAAVLAVLAIGIPLSTWSLVRLLRKPVGNVTYAN
jgi:hypothetical protein